MRSMLGAESGRITGLRGMLYAQQGLVQFPIIKTLSVNSMDYSKDYNDLPKSFFDGEITDEDSALVIDGILFDEEGE